MRIKGIRTSLGAMVWKETRENAIWAFLGALCLLGINYDLIFSPVYNSYQNFSYNYPPDVWNAVYARQYTTIGIGPLTAALLGIMQLLPELRRDQWAFLIHRPLTLPAIFWRKVAAGLLLYFVMMGSAMLILSWLWWAGVCRMSPFLPFDPRFFLGGLADLLAGVPFYFAALLCAVRPTRWYGSRALPLIGCIPLVFYCAMAQEFYQCLLATALCSAIMAFAACSSFAGQGHYSRQGKWGRLALGVALLPGIIAVGWVSLAALEGAISETFTAARPAADVREEEQEVYSYYALTPEGKVVRPNYFYETKRTVTDLDGQTLKNIDVKELREFAFRDDMLYEQSFRTPSRYFRFFTGVPEKYGQYAYTYLYSQTTNAVLVFDSTRSKLEGYILPSGYYPHGKALPKNSGFRGPLMWVDRKGMLWVAGGFYQIDSTRPVVKFIRDGQDIEQVNLLAYYKKVPDKQPGNSGTTEKLIRSFYGVVCTSAVEFYTKDGSQLFATSREHDRRWYGRVATQMNREGNRFFILYAPSSDIPEVKQRQMPYYLVTLNQKGDVLQRQTLPSLANQLPDELGLQSWEITGMGLNLPLAGVILYAAYYLPAILSYSLPLTMWFEQIVLYAPKFPTYAVLSTISALSCCILMWLLRKRCALNAKSLAVWLLAVLLLGPAGFLLFLAVRSWPVRIPCPTCNRKRVVYHESCEHCGAPWPEKPTDDTAIIVENTPQPAT